MKFIDLTIPLGIGTPPWPTYEPLQVKYFKRLAPNGAKAAEQPAPAAAAAGAAAPPALTQISANAA